MLRALALSVPGDGQEHNQQSVSVDVTDKITKKTVEVTEVDGMDVAREVTESNPGSPLNYPNDN